MTQSLIKEQINTIKKATEKASKTKESALKFLQDAGIVGSHTATSAKGTPDKKK
jgi:hypothetical protein